MRLPGVEQTFNRPVQELQGPNPEIAGSVGRAAQQLVQAASAIAQEIRLRDQEEKYTSAMSEANRQLTEVQTHLMSSNVVPTSVLPPDVEIDESDVLGQEDPETGAVVPVIPTYKVADKLWQSEVGRITSEFGSVIKNRDFRRRFEQSIAEAGDKVRAQIITRSYEEQQKYGAASARSALDRLVSVVAIDPDKKHLIDETLARQIAMGNMTEAAAIEMRDRTLQNIDLFKFNMRMSAAKAPDAVEDIRSDLWLGDHLLTPDQALQVDRLLERQQGQMDRERNKRHEEGYQRGFDLFVSGGLTMETVNNMLQDDQISAGGANTLKSFVEQLVKEEQGRNIDDTAYVQFLGGQILNASQIPSGTTAQWRLKELRQLVVQGVTGLTPMGKPVAGGQKISRETAQQLMDQIDKMETRIFRPPTYQMAKEQIQSIANVSYTFDGMLTGNQANRDAYVAFMRALNNHMDQMGSQADPMKFVTDNASRFDPARFQQGIGNKFIANFPEAAQFFTIPPSDDITGERIAERTGEISRSRVIAHVMEKSRSEDPLVRGRALELWRQYLAYYEGIGMMRGSEAMMLEQADAMIMMLLQGSDR